jgi:magnesium transporter
MDTALLFDRDAVEEIDDWADRIPHLGRSSVLWVDLERPDEADVRRLAEVFQFDEESVKRLNDMQSGAPHLSDFENYLHVSAVAPSEDRRLTRVSCLVSERWVVTVREAPLEVVDTFRERASGSGETGKLDGLDFLANLLEWMLASYFEAFEEIEVALEDIDTTAMSGEIDAKEETIASLVEVRREIGRLRRALTSHRELVLALTRPELDAISSSRSANRFMSLRDRLEDGVQAARDSRESVVGSFDVLIASTSQRTNDIMKVLTLASVLILPGTLLAGIMGMNFKLGLFDNAAVFWVVVAAMGATAIVTLAIARMRDWI